MTKTCDLLVVACDPRTLAKTCQITYSAAEQAVFDSLQNFTFHTTLVKVTVPATKPTFGIILKPQAVEDMCGHVSGYRNETAKQFSLEVANGMTENLVTVYQLQGPRATPWTNEQFLQNLTDTLGSLAWWPYPDYEVMTYASGAPVALGTPYFDHFDHAGLEAKMPWNYLGVQGTGNTIYVHGSTCFESVLQCWQYGGMMLEKRDTIGWTLPSDLGAPIIVLGAGPSGLMFAHRLGDMGYTNVEILESTDRFGGKTHTVTYDVPTPNGGKTSCELGTCYLSPAYDDMARHFAKCGFMDGNFREGMYLTQNQKDPKGHSIRGMVTEGQFDGVPMPHTMIDYIEYVPLKGYYQANQPFANPTTWLAGFNPKEVQLEIALKLLEYDALLARYLGLSLPMPLTPPQALLDANYTSFYDFLEKNDLLMLTGLLEYAYSVQGYGPLDQISAYYGMIWISIPLTLATLASSAGLTDEPGVTVLSKGWLDIWTQMAPTLNITLNAKVSAIDRVT
ncbi:MAG: FAD-dependent oxidoreductase [Roseovarius sp.]|nr:FAD-dependent oxidoreductase [Roseovarius sp.]